jgi:hypothetical protein
MKRSPTAIGSFYLFEFRPLRRDGLESDPLRDREFTVTKNHRFPTVVRHHSCLIARSVAGADGLGKGSLMVSLTSHNFVYSAGD